MARYSTRRRAWFHARTDGPPAPAYQDQDSVPRVVRSVSDRVPPPAYHKQGPLPEPRFDERRIVPPPVYDEGAHDTRRARSRGH